MAGERRLLHKHASEEHQRKEDAAARRRSSGNIWGRLGGVLATALTGGAAAPWLKGLAYAGGTYLGHKYGVSRSKTDEDLTGGLFYKKAGQDAIDLIDDEGLASSLKGGVGYTFNQLARNTLNTTTGVLPKSSGLFDFYNSPIGKLFSPKAADVSSVAKGTSFPMQYNPLINDLPPINNATNNLDFIDTSMIYDRFFDKNLYGPTPTKIDRKWRG